MDTKPGGNATNTTNTAAAAQAAEQLKSALSSADSNVSEGIQNLARVHQARLSQASRTVAALKAQYGAGDPRVKTAEASVAATNTTIARVSMVSQQLAVPAVQVPATGWALQGRVLDSQLQPAAKFTVFLVDPNRAFLRRYGFTYTDDTGYFLLQYAGETEEAGAQEWAPTQLFLEVANTDANPVYLSGTAFEPVFGSATFQNVVLPAGGQPIGDPPQAIREVALPRQEARTQPKTPPSKPSKPQKS